MKSLHTLIKLVRPVNLLIIILTQLLFWYYIVEPVYGVFDMKPILSMWQMAMLVLSTILIAGGGYVINDYYDLPIDLINKPERVIVSKSLTDNAAFNYYIGLTVAGVLSAFIVGISLGKPTLVLLPVVISSLLWFYAQQFKRMFLVGNIIVAFSTASVIFILLFFEVDWVKNSVELSPEINDILKFGLIYMIFAFLMTMLREVVKDLEDMEGDAQFDCKTLPVVWGVLGGKAVAIFWDLLVIAAIGWLQVQLFSFGNYLAFIYLLVFIQIPCLIIAFLTGRSTESGHFKRVSKWIKATMIFGIISMIYIGLILGRHG